MAPKPKKTGDEDVVVKKIFKSRFSLLPNLRDSSEEEEIEEEQADGRSTEAVHEEEYDYRPLTKPEVRVRLNWLGKIPDGDGYTYLKATCTNMQLTEIKALECFKNLQFVDLSNNFLTTTALQPITDLPYLLLLKVDNNKLISGHLRKCKYLQVLILNNNSLVSVEDIWQPELSTLEVGFNRIAEIKFTNKMDTIRVLDFRGNMIRELRDLNFPNLDSLYLAHNKIKYLIGLENLQNLRVLHVRNNPIRFLSGFDTDLPKLKYLNLRSCPVTSLKQVKKLKTLSSLEILILKNTLFMGGTGKEAPDMVEEEEDPEVRVEVLAALPRLIRLNKAPFTEDEQIEAKDLRTQWSEEGEKEEEEEVYEAEVGEEAGHPEDG